MNEISYLGIIPNFNPIQQRFVANRMLHQHFFHVAEEDWVFVYVIELVQKRRCCCFSNLSVNIIDCDCVNIIL